jgi:LYC1 GNAT-like C-terminal domain
VIIPGASQPTYATWIIDVCCLPVAQLTTRIRASVETFPVLLSAIMVAAIEDGAASVEVWNLEPHLMEIIHKLNETTGQRPDHLPSLVWYGSGNADDVQWLFNEKCVLSLHSSYLV